jgi:acetolactate synthase-1/2/3 large subunit
MARKDKLANVSRRRFMAGVALSGAVGVVTETARAATAPDASNAVSRRPSALRPTAQMAAAETGIPKELAKATGPDGSDYMVDVIKTLNIDYVCSNPASSFRGLHESLIDYGGNKKPEFITCTHEESSIGMCHGYFKATGKPLMMLCHGVVGLQHAAMAIYNAWCDRVPIIAVGGTDLDAAYRAPGVPTYHAAQDINALVRDFTKWDDQPVSLQHFAQSFVRAYKIAMTPPHEPVRSTSASSRSRSGPTSPRRFTSRNTFRPRHPRATWVPSGKRRGCLPMPSVRSLSPIAPPVRTPARGSWSSLPRPCRLR